MKYTKFNILFNMTDGTQEVIPLSVPTVTATDEQVIAAVEDYMREHPITPMYAESLEECNIDGAIYLLPDGFLYLPQYTVVKGEFFDPDNCTAYGETSFFTNYIPIDVTLSDNIILRVESSQLKTYPAVPSSPPWLQGITYYDGNYNPIYTLAPYVDWSEGEATFVIGTDDNGNRVAGYEGIAYVRLDIYCGYIGNTIPSGIIDSITIDGDAGLLRECAWVNSGITFVGGSGTSGGADGSVWHYGTAIEGTGSNIFMPVSGAKKGDFYLNTNTSVVYVAIEGAEMWKYVITLKGNKGDPGTPGTSVTITNVSESTADGGSNIVTFSNGKTLTVKNGSKGSKGDPGEKGDPGAAGATTAQVIAAMTKDTWTFTLEDGSTVTKVVPLV